MTGLHIPESDDATTATTTAPAGDDVPSHRFADRYLPWLVVTGWVTFVAWLASLPYCFEWDSAQYALGAVEFNLREHQPHPPGYPLWVAATRWLGFPFQDYLRPQRVLSAAFTLGGLFLFWGMAKRWVDKRSAVWTTLLLGCSPVVLLYAAAPLTYAVALFASGLVGFTMARMWDGRFHTFILTCGLLGLTGGFRQSAPTFLAPMLGWMAVYAWRRGAKREVLCGVAAGLVGTAVWYLPLAEHAGGFAELAEMNAWQLRTAASDLSVFYGAAWTNHAEMLFLLALYAGFAVSIPVLLRLASVRRDAATRNAAVNLPPIPHWSFWALWIAPMFAFNALIHSTKAGYLLLSMPPVLMLLARGVPARWLRVGVFASVVVALFPYAAIGEAISNNPRVHRAAFLFVRCTPQALHETAAIQDALIRETRQRPEVLNGYLLEPFQEAPNLRTLRYDIPHVRWHDGSREKPNRQQPVWLLAASFGMPGDWKEQHPDAVAVWRNYRVTLWLLADPGTNQAAQANQP